MSNDFVGIPPALLEAMREKYGDSIKSVTVCAEAFDGEQEIFILEDGEELEVEYPDEPDLEYEGEYNLVYLDGVIPVYERYYDPLYDDGEDEDWDEDYW